MRLDLVFFNALHSLVGQNRFLDWLGIFLADYLGYFLIIGAIVLIFRVKKFSQRFYYFAFIALSLILSRGLITEIIRFFYNRPRPFEILDFKPLINHGGGSSFPSGHAAFYFALVFAVIFLFQRKKSENFEEPEKQTHSFLWLWYLSGALLIGLARIFVGVHWPLDILGGAAIAFLSVVLINILLRTVQKKVF